MTIPDHPRPNEAAPPQQAENPPAIDVNAIMEQVRRSVAERRNAGIYPAQCRPTVRHVSKTTRDPDASGPPMARLWSDARIDLAGEPVTSHRRISGFFIKTFKKFARFWIRRYTDGLFLRQGHFNYEIVSAFATMKTEIEDMRAELLLMRQDLEASMPAPETPKENSE